MSDPSARDIPPDAIAVVAAVIRRDGQLLLCQRQPGPHLPLLWEFPGGKIDEGESPTEALARELREELSVEARVGFLLHEVVHRYPEKCVWIRFYATAIEGEPVAVVHREVRWVPLSSLLEFPAPPPNAEVIERIMNGRLALSDGAPR